jgi:NADH-quinone oxidoreductase subunit E
MNRWTPELQKRAQALLGRYPERRSALMPLLHLAMVQDGYLTEEGMREVAAMVGLTPAQVRGVASFYSIYKLAPVGCYLLSVCCSISCHLLEAEAVMAAIEAETGVSAGETGADGLFSVEKVECLGACGGAPAIEVNYELVEGVGSEQARALCRWLREERPAVVVSDQMQDRFGGRRSFDRGPADPTGAVMAVPAFGPYGSVGEGR